MPHIFLLCRCSGNGGPGGTVALARKLAVFMHRMLADGASFRHVAAV
jgi:hypothetical protein